MIRLRICPLPDGLQHRPGHLLLFLMIRFQGIFWRGLVNGALLALTLLYGVLQCSFHGPSIRWCWLLLQLLLMPLLMAGEEFSHIILAFQKGLSRRDLDVVAVYRVGRRGRPWLCYGAAVRWQGSLSPLDRMHISACGPALSLLLAAVLWAGCSLVGRGALWNEAHVVCLPTLGYLLGSLIPASHPISTDIANILRAKNEAGYGWWRTVRICLHGLFMIWSSADG